MAAGAIAFEQDEVILWSLFPVVTALSFRGIPALISLAWCSLFAGLFFGVIVAYRRRWSEFRQAAFWRAIAGVIAFTGVLYYVLYFTGLEYTTPGNAGIIAQFEIFAAYLFFNIIRREPFSRAYAFGAGLLALGAVMVIGRSVHGVNIGDILVFAAAVLAPAGNFFQRKARAVASSESIMFVRSVVSAVVIGMLAVALGKHASVADIRSVLPLVLFNGALILGLSKFFWIEGIFRLPVAKCNAFNGITPFLTLLVAWTILGQQPTVWQLSALVPMLLGVLFLTDILPLKRTSAVV
jgi:drug/metabolite transporter (DMT)-like permease